MTAISAAVMPDMSKLTISSTPAKLVTATPQPLNNTTNTPAPAPTATTTNQPDIDTSSDTAQPINTSAVPQPYQPDLSTVYALQDELHQQIDTVQHHTTQLLQQHQADLLHDFHVRITELSQALADERKQRDTGSTHWMNECQKQKQTADTLTTSNNDLKRKLQEQKQKNKQLSDSLARSQADHTHMVQQVHKYKQYIAELQAQVRSTNGDADET